MKKRLVSITVDEEFHLALRDYCRTLGIPMSTVGRTLLEEFVNKQMVIAISVPRKEVKPSGAEKNVEPGTNGEGGISG